MKQFRQYYFQHQCALYIGKIVFFLTIACIGHVRGQINAVGSWNLIVSSAEITEAGANFLGTYESSPSQILIDVNRHQGNKDTYKVQVKKSDK